MPTAAAENELLKQGILGLVILASWAVIVYLWRAWMAERAAFAAERAAFAAERTALIAQHGAAYAMLIADAKAYGVLAQQLSAQCAAAINGVQVGAQATADALERLESAVRDGSIPILPRRPR